MVLLRFQVVSSNPFYRRPVGPFAFTQKKVRYPADGSNLNQWPPRSRGLLVGPRNAGCFELEPAARRIRPHAGRLRRAAPLVRARTSGADGRRPAPSRSGTGRGLQARAGTAGSRLEPAPRSPGSSRHRGLPARPGAQASTDQLRLRELDLRAGQGAGNGTVLLGVLRVLAEAGFVQPRNVRLGRQLDARDRETFTHLLDAHLRRRRDPLRLQPRTGQSRRERHGEAARVRRRDQLLRIRALPFLEARRERVRPFVRTALHPHRALPLPERAPPLRSRRSYRHTFLPVVRV